MNYARGLLFLNLFYRYWVWLHFFHIEKGKLSITLDGASVDGTEIQLVDDGNTHKVEIKMG